MPRTKLNPQAQSPLYLSYTAIEVGKHLGISNRSVTKWWEKISEIWYWKLDELVEDTAAANLKFTQEGLHCLQQYQKHCSTKIPLTNDDGLVIRDDDGKPLMQPNCDRISFEQYKTQVWDECNRHPEARVDAPLVPVTDAVYDAEILETQESAIARVDDLSGLVDNSLTNFQQLGTLLGDAISTQVIDTMTERINTNINQAVGSLGKALDPRGRGGRAGETVRST